MLRWVHMLICTAFAKNRMGIDLNQTDTFIAVHTKDIQVLGVGSQTNKRRFIKVKLWLLEEYLIKLHHSCLLDLILWFESFLEIHCGLSWGYCRIHLYTFRVIFRNPIIRWENCIRFIVDLSIFIECLCVHKQVWVVNRFLILFFLIMFFAGLLLLQDFLSCLLKWQRGDKIARWF